MNPTEPNQPPLPPPTPPSRISPINIEAEMKEAYIDYAMSVIIGRALPDVCDGLKPVHRRILYAMYDQGFTSKKPHVKCARTVGEVLGKYHPHGDAAVYDTMVRMAQEFTLRYPLIDGHGNFGSIDGDSPAAMRYTEARLSSLAEEMLKDLEMETVDWVPNFDESLMEPKVLPCKFPNLLVNGSSGIAVAMATNIPPHHLGEIISGVLKVIENPEVSIEEIMNEVPGPDFPTGGIIMGREGIDSAYRTGRGSIVVKACTKIETFGKGRDRIVVTELPYQVNKAKLIIQIADLVKEKKIDGITDLRDESNREGMRVCIELRKGVNTEVILNQLFQRTPMRSSFGVIMLVLVDSRPRVLDLKSLMVHYADHCRNIIRRRTSFQLKKAEERSHILEGLTIALDHLDAVIIMIREAKSPAEAKGSLVANFMLSEIQAQAILDMRLQRLTGLEREKIVQEYHESLALIARLKDILASDLKIREIVRGELLEIKEKFSDERRTQISEFGVEQLDAEDLMQETDILITVTQNGYIKRVLPDVFRQQKRGTKGSFGMGVKEDDVIEHVFLASTHSFLLVFTSCGRVHWIKGYKIPEGGKQASGRAIVNLLNLSENEKITAFLPIRTFDSERKVLMATKKGIVKTVELSSFSRPSSKSIKAIKLDEGDELVAVKTIRGGEHVVIATRKGFALRFPESLIRVMGRSAHGVKGIRFRDDDDVVIGMEVFSPSTKPLPQPSQIVIPPPSETTQIPAPPESEPELEDEEIEKEEGVEEVPPVPYIQFDGVLLTVTECGFGRQTDVNKYRVTGRGGKGVKNMGSWEKTGDVIAIKRMFEDDELVMITRSGKVVRVDSGTIRTTLSRRASGVKLISLSENDSLISVARIPASEEKVD
ncbi:DNA gyrase subunit A [bacterium]|nr:DNA gyrase subunit A [bacterium]